MEPWLHVATVAFVAQLSVLPGEKVQFIIAGLATRYHPLLVVGAAGSAFAGWTALEIAFGNLLRETLPGVYLDLLTGVLFLAFAVLLFRSAPAPGSRGATTGSGRRTDGGERTDGSGAAVAGGADADAAERSDAGPLEAASTTESEAGAGDDRPLAGELDVRVPVVGWRVPNLMGDFLPIFALMAVGEFGDKTQLVTIGLAAQFANGSAIWAGEMAAIIPVSLANAYFFSTFSGTFDLRTAHLAGAALFAFFGVDTLQAIATGVSVWETLVRWMATLGADAVNAVVTAL